MKHIYLISFLLFSINIFCQNFEQGVLNRDEKIKLFEELNILSNVKIDSLKTVIIHFFDKPKIRPNGSCIDHYTSDKTYSKFIKDNQTIKQFFMSQKDYKYNKKAVIEDRNNIIRTLIFEKAQSCGNYIIIKPDGKFFKVFGEYHQDLISKVIEKI
jgi:hypothetical protein